METSKERKERPQSKYLKKFTKDYQPDPSHKAVPRKKTLIKRALGISKIEDLAPLVLENWEFLSKLKSKKDKQFVSKELTPYVFPKKSTQDLNVKGEIKLIVNGIEKL